MQGTCPEGRLAFPRESSIELGRASPCVGNVSQEESTHGVSPRVLFMETK
jgi:hypothetical protein